MSYEKKKIPVIADRRSNSNLIVDQKTQILERARIAQWILVQHFELPPSRVRYSARVLRFITILNVISQLILNKLISIWRNYGYGHLLTPSSPSFTDQNSQVEYAVIKKEYKNKDE